MTNPHSPVPEEDVVLLIKNPHRAGSLGQLLSTIGAEGALISDIVTQFIGRDSSIREITVSVHNPHHLQQIENTIRDNTEAEILEVKDLVFERHEGGKIRSGRTHELERLDDLRYIYTPGVARVCRGRGRVTSRLSRDTCCCWIGVNVECGSQRPDTSLKSQVRGGVGTELKQT